MLGSLDGSCDGSRLGRFDDNSDGSVNGVPLGKDDELLLGDKLGYIVGRLLG